MASKPEHLCVLVHGLWGNPGHLNYLTNTLRETYSEDELHILVVKRNSGSFTYDGIETGGERIANEVENTLEDLARSGHSIKKISFVGYSLGGLLSRYAIGLLSVKGLFEEIEPVNFTTFATPHLGVRTPLRGYLSQAFNVLGARTLSISGRQIFLIDKFRDTGRPLLSVLADPDSIFIRALRQFRYRSLYANIVNDKSVAYYTAGISKTDPFVDPDAVQINYLQGYEDVILNADDPVSEKEAEELPTFHQRLTRGAQTFMDRLPIYAFLVLFVPIGSTLYLLNSAVQSVRSGQRIRLHEEGRAGIDVGGYRIPLMINYARHEVQDMFEHMNNAQPPQYLEDGSEELASPTRQRSSSTAAMPSATSDTDSIPPEKPLLGIQVPTLALTPEQFEMVDNLDSVGFRKFPVYIHKHHHSHAAIIRRMEKASFDEGRVVVRHWLDNFIL